MEEPAATDQRKARIRALLVEAQQGLLLELDALGPDDWGRATPDEGWSVRDLLLHLASAEAGFVATLRRMAAGQGGVPEDFDADRWNAGQLRRRTESTPAALRADLDTAHARMLELLESLDGAALDQRGGRSGGGEGWVEDPFARGARHKRSHTADLQAALR